MYAGEKQDSRLFCVGNSTHTLRLLRRQDKIAEAAEKWMDMQGLGARSRLQLLSKSVGTVATALKIEGEQIRLKFAVTDTSVPKRGVGKTLWRI